MKMEMDTTLLEVRTTIRVMQYERLRKLREQGHSVKFSLALTTILDDGFSYYELDGDFIKVSDSYESTDEYYRV